MKRYTSVLCTLLLAVQFFAPALEVDKAELESAGSANSIVFINYSGPHQIINTIDEIRKIGIGLGKVIAKNLEKETNAGQTARYYVIHAVDPTVTEKLDADILILGERAGVDHVDNLRRIIGAYLETAYGYPAQTAQTLAVFVTVYNAVYRSNIDTFYKKYKNVVTKHLSADKVGLSVNYADWPGKTQIVIPLSDIRGGTAATVDTSVISDTKVIESMQKEPDKGIKERKNMVSVKEAEADKAQAKAEKAQNQATEAKKEAAVEKEKLNEAKKEAALAKKEAEAKPADKQAQKKAEEAEKKVIIQEEKTAQAEQKADDLEKTAEKEQAVADKKQNEAQKERIEIAKDQQQLIRENAALGDVITAAYGLKITDDRELLSGMVLVDTKTGRTVKESPVTVIRNRVIYPEGKDFIAVAGKTGGNAAVKLVKLDGKTMEIIGETAEILAVNSVLVKEGAFYYVIIQDGKNYVAAKYGADLKQVVKSNVPVNPATPITISELGVTVTDTYGFAKLLKADNLQGVE